MSDNADALTMATNNLTALVADLFEQYHEAIFAYVYRLVDDRDLAHELTQETFLRVHRTRHKLPAVDNRRAWIYRIASNLTFNRLKRRNRFALLPWRSTDSPQHAAPDIAGYVATKTAVEAALANLSPTYRAPLLLFSHYGLSVREVAEALDISEAAVKTRLHRARKQFRRAYGGDDPEERE